MRVLVVAGLLLVAGGCSDGGGFLEQWPEIPEGPDYEGQPTRVDEDKGMLYIEDCAAAREATSEDGPEAFRGYGFVCE